MRPAVRADANRHWIIPLAAAAAGMAVIAGATLPWLTVFNGLRSYSGIAGLNGRLLAGGGAAAIVLAGWYGARPRRQLRLAIGTLGFALSLFSVYLLAQLLDVYRGLQGVYLPALGPGLVLAIAGALLMIATLFIGIADGGRPDLVHLESPAALLIALSTGAGTIHLAVAAAHFVEFPLYGVFFVVLGIAQIGWAGLMAIRGAPRQLLLAATGNALVVWLWIVSRTVGMPIGPGPWVPEPVELAGVASTAFEVLLIAFVIWLVVRPQRFPSRLSKAGWLLPLIVGTTAVVAILTDVAAHSQAAASTSPQAAASSAAPESPPSMLSHRPNQGSNSSAGMGRLM